MAIIDLQRRVHEAGRIRIGQQVPTSGGRGKRPTKLSTFRLTSPNKTRIAAAAELYGGEAREWEAPAGQQWEVITTSDALRVIVPPTEFAFTQWYELWSAAGCQRRCTGALEPEVDWETAESISNGPCLCDPDARECKPHTRLSVMLADMPGLGVWRLETQGWNAALELQGAVEVIHLAARHGQLLPATLRLEQRMSRKVGEGTRRFAVPVLDLDVTPAQMIGATRFGPALDYGERPELAQSMRSIAAAPVELDRPSNFRAKPETPQVGDADEAQSDNRVKPFRGNVMPAGAGQAAGKGESRTAANGPTPPAPCSAAWRTIKCQLSDGHSGKHRGQTSTGEAREWALNGRLTPVAAVDAPPASIFEQAGAEIKSRRRSPGLPPPAIDPRPARDAAVARDEAEQAPPAPQPRITRVEGTTGEALPGPRAPAREPAARREEHLDDRDDGAGVPCPATYGSSRLQCNRELGHPGQHNVSTDSARYRWGDEDENAGEPARVCHCGQPDAPGSHSPIHCIAGGPGRQCGTCGARGEHAPGCPDADPTDSSGGAAYVPEGPATGPQNRKMHALFRELGLTDRDDRLIITGRILGYELNTSTGMTISEAGTVIDILENLIDVPGDFTLSNGQEASSAEQWITDVINSWVASQAENEDSRGYD